MSKNVILYIPPEGVELEERIFEGVSIIQLNTTDGGVAQFQDVDEAAEAAGVLNFVEKGTLPVGNAGAAYWRAYGGYDTLFTPAYEYGILLVDWEGTHAGTDSVNGIQTQMFVYTPTEYRYVGHGYRSGTGAQTDTRLDGIRSAASIRADESARGNGNMYTGYISAGATAVTAKEAQLTKEQADVFMAIFSGCYGYTAS